MQKNKLAFACSLVLIPFITGCEESVVTALKDIINRTPTATLAAPSYTPGPSALKASGSATLSVSFANAHTVNLAVGTGSAAAPPAGLTVVPSGPACTNVAISAVSTSGATITVSGCSGDGDITVQVAAGAIDDEAGVASAASAIQTVTVDTTTPATSAYTVTKASSTSTGANTVVVTFTEEVQDLSTTNANGEFTVTGCSGTQPSVAIAMTVDGSGNSIATATLSGGTCADGETVTVALNLDKVNDLAGNAGLIADNPTDLTYDIDTALPTATAFAVTDATVGATTGANTVTATFSELIQAISTTNANGVFTVTGCSTAPAVAVVMSDDGSGHSIATATLSGGTCADTTTVSVTLNLDKVFDVAGNQGSAASNPTPETYLIDTAAVTVDLSAPVYSGGGGAMDSTGTATLTLTLAHAASTTLANGSGTGAAPPAGISAVETVASCTGVDLNQTAADTWEITVSGCSLDGTIQLQVDAGIATSHAGAASSASVVRTVIIDN